jgi:hypothetical protein
LNGEPAAVSVALARSTVVGSQWMAVGRGDQADLVVERRGERRAAAGHEVADRTAHQARDAARRRDEA